MTQILLPNAYNAWKNAIYYHDRIENGYFALEYQKGFVSSLHNAVELFLKQIMLNNNDKNVAKLNSIKSETDAQLALSYFQAKKLNDFFVNISPEEINKFRSIEFSELLNKANKLLDTEDDDKSTVNNALKALNILRNNETHFYISNNYLSESDFKVLHNFMVLFYDLIAHKELFPCVIQDLKQIGMKDYIQIPKEYCFFAFDRSIISEFSYKDALINNSLANELKESLTGEYSYIYSSFDTDNAFTLTEVLSVYEKEKYSSKLYETFVILTLMNSLELISLIEDDDGTNKITIGF